MEIIAVIPARGGSKGLPGKNIRALDGHPLIAYSIAAAKQSRRINRIICTTDSPEIAATAKKYGAETPFVRPASLATDTSTDLEVFKHLLIWLDENENYQPDLLVQLRPTSPLRSKSLVDLGIEKIHQHPKADSLRSVCQAPSTPYKMWKIDKYNDTLLPLLKLEGIAEPYNSPRQILPDIYWQTGMLDITRPRVIEKLDSMTGRVIIPLVVDRVLAVDIDTIKDFIRAEEILKEIKCVRPE